MPNPTPIDRRQWLRLATGLGGTAAAALMATACQGAGPAATGTEPVPPAPEPPPSPPAPPGWRLAADFEPTAEVWLSHDAGHETLTTGLVAALRPHVALRCWVADDAATAPMRAVLRARGEPADAVGFAVDPDASFYLRDMAVLGHRPGGTFVVDLRWTQYGIPAWCAQRHGEGSRHALHCSRDTDYSRERVDRTLARLLGAPTWRSGLALEGGGFETNGQGLVIANEALYRSRNPGRSLAELQALLLAMPGVRKVIWLPNGLAEDTHLRGSITPQHVAWGTGGHTDEFVRFADARTVLLAWPEDADAASHPVARITRQRMQRCWEILSAATDAAGAPLRVLKVPMPRVIERRIFLSAIADHPLAKDWSADQFPPADKRWQGQPLLQVATASYLNFVVANGVVVLPDYRPHGTPRALQDKVRRVFEQAFAGRQLVFVDAISANWLGGGMHCATLNIPAAA